RRHRPAVEAVDGPEIGDRHQWPWTDHGDRARGRLRFGGGDGHGCDRRLCGMSPGRLLLAATPLGLPADASARLISGLSSADVVAAEDTRRVRTLPQGLDVRIAGKVVSLYDQNEATRVPALVDDIKGGA